MSETPRNGASRPQDARDGTAGLVRPYARTGGRTKPGRDLDLEALVMTASVRSGTISDTAPTKVVLPAPNPPDTTIFVEREGRRSEPLKATEHPPQECGVTFVAIGCRGLEDLDEAEVDHVGDDDAGHRLMGQVGQRLLLDGGDGAQCRQRPLEVVAHLRLCALGAAA